MPVYHLFSFVTLFLKAYKTLETHCLLVSNRHYKQLATAAL